MELSWSLGGGAFLAPMHDEMRRASGCLFGDARVEAKSGSRLAAEPTNGRTARNPWQGDMEDHPASPFLFSWR